MWFQDYGNLLQVPYQQPNRPPAGELPPNEPGSTKLGDETFRFHI